jgi:hypothetical protein
MQRSAYSALRRRSGRGCFRARAVGSGELLGSVSQHNPNRDADREPDHFVVEILASSMKIVATGGSRPFE